MSHPLKTASQVLSWREESVERLCKSVYCIGVYCVVEYTGR